MARGRKSKARQYNCQAKKDQGTNNDKRHTTMIIFLYNVIFVDIYSTFDWNDDYDNISFVLDKYTDLDLSSASSQNEQSAEYKCCSSRTYYPDSEPTSLCSVSNSPIFDKQSQ
jgi:hypothetical protein